MGSKKLEAAIVLITCGVLVLLYFVWPDYRWNVDTVWGILSAGDIQGFKEYLLGFGVWAPVVSAAIMLVHSIIPFPAIIITLTNGLLFGAFWGTVLSWSTAMLGAAICYWLAKAFGRPAIEKFVGAKNLKRADNFFDHYGSHAVLITRLIPVVSFDLISYAAGLTTISFFDFMVATGIGQLSATIVYSFLGENITGGAKMALFAFGGVVALFVLGFAVKRNIDRKLASNQSSAN